MKAGKFPRIRTIILCLFLMTMSNLALAACDPSADYGGRFVLSIRDCTTVPDEDSCAATTSPIEFYLEYCLGLQVNESISLPGFGSADGTVQYNGPASLPTIRQTAITTDDSRNGSTVDSWQVYTYGGAGPIILPIVGNLSYDYSGGNGTSSGINNGWFVVSLLVLDGDMVDVADFLQSYSGYRLSQASCGDEGFFGLPDGAIIAQDGHITYGGSAGAAAFTLDVSKRCDDQTDVMVDTGDSFIVAALSQAIADRGGYVDMSHTLAVTFAEDTPPEVLMELVDNIEPACGDDCGHEQMDVQIKTGGNSCLKPNEDGMIFVSVFGSDSMDVSEIRVDESLILGSPDIPLNTQLHKCKEGNINEDGFVDLDCKFKHSVVEPSYDEASEVLLRVRGIMTDGTPFEGVDTACLAL